MSAAATEAPVAPAAAPAKRSLLPIIIVGLLAAAGGGGGAYFMASKGASAKAEEHPAEAAEGHGGTEGGEAARGTAVYLTLQPAFVVNLDDQEAARYLQVEMELMARDTHALDEAKNHMPRIRNALVLLMGSRRVSDLATRAGKEKLQADVLVEVQKVLTEATGKPQVSAVYFNSFVMQ